MTVSPNRLFWTNDVQQMTPYNASSLLIIKLLAQQEHHTHTVKIPFTMI